ncbi:MAG: EthD domain-containing protein [Polymorphobacter sp.]
MEKIVAVLWKPDAQPADAFNAALLAQLGPELQAAGARHVRLNLQDATVAPGAGLRQVNTQPQMDAIAQFWLPSANARFRDDIDAALARHSARVAAWIAVESTIIANTAHPPVAGERTWGFSQSTFLGLPPRLTHAEWRHIWQTTHTQVAIETQANFEYVQHVLVQPLQDDGPEFAGFVEECFPLAALTDPNAFFDAVGDQAKFDRNLASMMESCGRFIDFDRIDVLITSQFDL